MHATNEKERPRGNDHHHQVRADRMGSGEPALSREPSRLLVYESHRVMVPTKATASRDPSGENAHAVALSLRL